MGSRWLGAMGRWVRGGRVHGMGPEVGGFTDGGEAEVGSRWVHGWGAAVANVGSRALRCSR
ncbi:hypothetical protein Patl1_08962 [Pistacia atlantica]|uniref:Uncharacterized protein n=1 Tax=Pistacia atlantica TaxID=434234 RepID=A0ACC1AI90_9ROSI|nr:hypothetical protein Patl1_08962 [Pistacia atlantica]